MKKKIFICTHSQLPHGDANSNYIFHMALSLVNEGFEVIVIGRSKTIDACREMNNGVMCINLPKIQKISGKIEGHTLYGNRLCNELDAQHIHKDDYIIVYGGYVSLFLAIAKRMSFMEQGHINSCVVEWPTRKQFKYKAFDPDYLLWKYVFGKMIPKWKKVIVISENLQTHFNKMGCKTFLLPPLINSDAKVVGKKRNLEKVQFIYAGADAQKDAISNMLLGIEELSEEERKAFVFHITSLTAEKARKLLGEKQYILDKYSECINIHGWIDYAELMNLYYSADYLLLARETNQFTLSNFPSKVPEMMNYGIIPVCSSVGDYTSQYLRHMIDSVIFDGANPMDCAEAMRLAISIPEDQRKKMSEQSIITAKKRFDYRMWGKELAEFISH